MDLKLTNYWNSNMAGSNVLNMECRVEVLRRLCGVNCREQKKAAERKILVRSIYLRSWNLQGVILELTTSCYKLEKHDGRVKC